MVLSIGSLAVYPGNAIVMQRVRTEMFEAQDSRDDRSHGAQEQQSTCELVSSLAHETPKPVAHFLPHTRIIEYPERARRQPFCKVC